MCIVCIAHLPGSVWARAMRLVCTPAEAVIYARRSEKTIHIPIHNSQAEHDRMLRVRMYQSAVIARQLAGMVNDDMRCRWRPNVRICVHGGDHLWK